MVKNNHGNRFCENAIHPSNANSFFQNWIQMWKFIFFFDNTIERIVCTRGLNLISLKFSVAPFESKIQALTHNLPKKKKLMVFKKCKFLIWKQNVDFTLKFKFVEPSVRILSPSEIYLFKCMLWLRMQSDVVIYPHSDLKFSSRHFE